MWGGFVPWCVHSVEVLGKSPTAVLAFFNVIDVGTAFAAGPVRSEVQDGAVGRECRVGIPVTLGVNGNERRPACQVARIVRYRIQIEVRVIIVRIFIAAVERLRFHRYNHVIGVNGDRAEVEVSHEAFVVLAPFHERGIVPCVAVSVGALEYSA